MRNKTKIYVRIIGIIALNSAIGLIVLSVIKLLLNH